MKDASIEIQGEKVSAYFQPYFDTRPGQPLRGELLTRPIHLKNPAEFFSSLQIEKQLILLEWLVDIGNELAEKYDVQSSINIHNSLIEADTGREFFLELCQKASSPMTFEFTETFRMPPVEVSNAMLRKVREFGHKTALDDFGTGLNGMSLLTDYDFDVIKLDRILSMDIDTSPKKAKVLGLIREMITVLGKQHVVEGVESKAVYEQLKALNFTTFQGFYFRKPQLISELLEEFEKGEWHEVSDRT